MRVVLQNLQQPLHKLFGQQITNHLGIIHDKSLNKL